MSEDLTQFNTRIPKSLYERFKNNVEAEEKTISKVMERLIESYVSEDDSNELEDDINWEQKLDSRIAIALEGVTCPLPLVLDINQLGAFYSISPSRLNKTIREQTNSNIGEQFTFQKRNLGNHFP